MTRKDRETSMYKRNLVATNAAPGGDSRRDQRFHEPVLRMTDWYVRKTRRRWGRAKLPLPLHADTGELQGGVLCHCNGYEPADFFQLRIPVGLHLRQERFIHIQQK